MVPVVTPAVAPGVVVNINGMNLISQFLEQMFH